MLGEEINEVDSKIIYLCRHGETNWNVDDRVTRQLENNAKMRRVLLNYIMIYYK